MTTSRITFRRRIRRSALALAVSAICLPSSALAQGDTKYDLHGASAPPAAKVGDTPADFPSTSAPPAAKVGDTPADFPSTSAPTGTRVGDTPAEFPGMPGGPVVIAEPVSGDSPEAGGFDWTSAAIGAAGAGLLVLIALGGASAASRIHIRTVRS